MASISKATGRTRRRWFGVTTAALAATSLLVGLMVATSGALLPSSPSQFESADGNMTLDTNLNTDWNCFNPSVNLTDPTTTAACNAAVNGVVFGAPNGASPAVSFVAPNAYTTSDPSWKSGQKMDQGTCIPLINSKSSAKDTFTHVASYNETAVTGGGGLGDSFLYGATERQSANGDASENVELSQVSPANAPAPGCTGGIFRSLGDKLIALNYTNGGANLLPPTILTWITTSAGLNKGGVSYAGTCLVGSDSPPCWSSTVKTAAAGTFEGAANGNPITAADNGISGDNLVAAQFAEFGIDLSAPSVGVIPQGACQGFSQETWESRSSATFTSNPSDIETEAHPISNCGNVTVIKRTDPLGLSQEFDYTSSGLTSGGLGNSKAGGVCSGLSDAGAFCLNNDATTPTKGADNTDNTLTTTGVSPGPISISETTTNLTSEGFALKSVVCNDLSATTGNPIVNLTGPTNNTASFTLPIGHSVQCVYTNKQLPGAIQITKESSKTATAKLAGATFEVTDSSGNPVGTAEVTQTGVTAGTTDSNGVACFDSLPVGVTYYVIETSPPANYGNGDPANTPPYNASNPPSAKSVEVTKTDTCGSSDVADLATVTIQDPPLTDITASATSEDKGPGGSQSSVSCVNTSNGTAFAVPRDPVGSGVKTSPSVSGTGLLPGTYTCTIVVDP